VTPKNRNATLRKKPGRPSDKKTPAALLRSILSTPRQTNRFLKRKGQYKIERVKLPVSTVANWLGVAEDTVRCIERGRPGYPLTAENAEKLAHHTGVSVDWLLADDVSKPMVNFKGEPYTQNDFDERQESLLHPSPDYDLSNARMTLASCCAKIAAILVHGAEHDRFDEGAYKLKRALRSVYFEDGEKIDWPMRFNPAFGSRAGERPDFSPLFYAFESDLRKIQQRALGRVKCSNPECSDGFVPCPQCFEVIGQVDGKTIKEILTDKRTGQPIDCKACGNKRIQKCNSCKTMGRA
jgi:hypothetical protein